MQQRHFIVGIAFMVATFSLVVTTLAFRGGPKGGWNGSFASNNTADSCMMCHGSATGSGSVQILGAPIIYKPNTVYDLIVQISDPNSVGAGFQLSAEDDNGNHVGSLIISDSVNTQVAPIEAGWVTHTATGVDNSIQNWHDFDVDNSAEYSIQWRAPATDVGLIHFFAAGNAVDNSRNTLGDIVYLTSVIAQPFCDDGIVCTDDNFEGTACVFNPIDANCPDDGIFCNGQEFCNGNLGCVSIGNPCPQSSLCDEQGQVCAECLIDNDCDDGVACTVDRCVNGFCSVIADSSFCPDNGFFCDGDEICTAASGCTSTGTPCGAGLFCSEVDETCDACEPGLPCDDEDICTSGDTCIFGVCTGTPIPNCCVTDADCVDADPCTDEACTAGQCVLTPSAICIEPADADMDNDGITDDIDDCPNTETNEVVDEIGCSCAQLDTDNDGVVDCVDSCSNSSPGTVVNDAGCADTQIDDDNDGIPNAADQCSATLSDEQANDAGCSPSQIEDDDADQVIPDMPDPPMAMPGGFSLCGTFSLLTMISLLTGLVAMRFASKRGTTLSFTSKYCLSSTTNRVNGQGNYRSSVHQ